MELHAPTDEAATARRYADEVRGEMARQRVTAAELAGALGLTQHTVGRRLNGSKPFSIIELHKVAAVLGIALDELVARATSERAELKKKPAA